MRYEAPAVEQRIEVAGPVIAGLSTPGRSAVTITPTSKHDGPRP